MKIDLSKMSFETLIVEHNPLAFKTDKGDIAYYPTYVKVYEELLDRLHGQNPSGYIDVVLFITDNCGVPPSEAPRYSINLQRVARLPDPCTVDWMEGGKERDRILRLLAYGLHDMTETSFDKTSFDLALDNWKRKLNIQN